MAKKGQLKKKGTSKKKVAKKASDKKSPAKSKGPRLNKAWADLFAENERLPKAKKMTDAQLTKRMEEIFPSKKGKSTLELVHAIRCVYNKGTNMFLKFGPAKTPSRRYDEDGGVIEGRAKGASEKTSSKKASKKKSKKKAASKK